ncbi:nucleoside-diphosphate sugar epimerase/dehydratase [Janibacter limosus]|uniref:nucleoside-diphosphate sugar epimerase/dehydratase n=1 Tax=Janibacter limosus TaxID=53458 RepID=UPI00082DEEEE|nr:nucleoside-diphosphate sugar epimerase/dehydratase [Janibacter limosus]
MKGTDSTREQSTQFNRWSWVGVDVLVVVVAVLLAALLRYDFNLDLALSQPVAWLTVIAGAGHLVIGTLTGPYAVDHLRGSYEEIVDIARTVALWAVPLLLVSILLPYDLGPRSLPLTVGAMALLGMFGARFVLRASRSRSRRLNATTTDSRVLVFGAGEGGRQLVRAIVRDTSSEMRAVGLLDDDRSKRKIRIDGVRVLGTSRDILSVALETKATTLAIAVPSANPELVTHLKDAAIEADLETLILPRTSELLGQVAGGDLRSLDLADFLGRRPIELDASAIANTISGRTVLVTGAGGSIGSELCRQIHKFGPKRLIMLDRDESALHGTELSVTGQGLLDSDDIVLADIRDRQRMIEVFEHHQPDVVFHAAALKHLPLLEMYPEEAWKTNVLGTLNVLGAAQHIQVKTFVNVSTDKAANPSCVLGYSKRVTERLTADFADKDKHTYVSVRFGNVLGSRGSVITAFTAQIEQGGPITVTHPDVERYFMLIPEACQLVLQAAAIGRDGEVMVLDMGKPAKIQNIATTLIELSGRNDIEIIYTGLRPGEKMSEELFTPGETIRRTDHNLVNSVLVPSISADYVSSTQHGSPDNAAEWMKNHSREDNHYSNAH